MGLRKHFFVIPVTIMAVIYMLLVFLVHIRKESNNAGQETIQLIYIHINKEKPS